MGLDQQDALAVGAQIDLHGGRGPAGLGLAEIVADVDDLCRAALEDCRAEDAGGLVGELEVEHVFDDVEDRVDRETNNERALAEHQHGLAPFPADRTAARGERHQAATVLDDETTAGHLEGRGVDLFEARHKR